MTPAPPISISSSVLGGLSREVIFDVSYGNKKSSILTLACMCCLTMFVSLTGTLIKVDIHFLGTPTSDFLDWVAWSRNNCKWCLVVGKPDKNLFKQERLCLLPSDFLLLSHHADKFIYSVSTAIILLWFTDIRTMYYQFSMLYCRQLTLSEILHAFRSNETTETHILVS